MLRDIINQSKMPKKTKPPTLDFKENTYKALKRYYSDRRTPRVFPKPKDVPPQKLLDQRVSSISVTDIGTPLTGKKHPVSAPITIKKCPPTRGDSISSEKMELFCNLAMDRIYKDQTIPKTQKIQFASYFRTGWHAYTEGMIDDFIAERISIRDFIAMLPPLRSDFLQTPPLKCKKKGLKIYCAKTKQLNHHKVLYRSQITLKPPKEARNAPI